MKNKEISKLLPSEKIYIAQSEIAGAGRGVFAKQNIQKNKVIEVCPLITVPKSDPSNADKGLLTHYYFYVGDNNELLAIALGFGSIYNHSYKPNATYIKELEKQTISFIAIKNIKKDEEITVNYNFGKPDDKSAPYNKGVPPYEG